MTFKFPNSKWTTLSPWDKTREIQKFNNNSSTNKNNYDNENFF